MGRPGAAHAEPHDLHTLTAVPDAPASRADSAIRNSVTQRSDHAQRREWSAPVRTLPSFGTVVGPPLLCQEAGRIARMSAIRI